MDIEMGFAWIPPGAFLMGGNTNDNEKPVHRVKITKGFYLGIVPVTQFQWEAVLGYNPSSFRGHDRPVENVSWNDCQEFCQALSRLTNKLIRLPTEAEWEYACRAGTTTEYYSGNDEAALKKVGWYAANSGKQTQPVAMLAPNAWGLYDMHGNVWEWCQDTVEDYRDEDVENPLYENGDSRVLRGGSWRDDPVGCRAAFRADAPSGRDSDVGCRVCFRPD